MRIECPIDQAIDVTAVFYGRLDLSTCPSEGAMGDTSCSLNKAIDKVGPICQNRRTCSLQSPEQDPCPHTYKYLRVTYVCRGK